MYHHLQINDVDSEETYPSVDPLPPTTGYKSGASKRTRLIQTLGCCLLFSTFLWLVFYVKDAFHHQRYPIPFIANLGISNTPINSIIEATPDTVYYLEQGVRTLDDSTTSECAVLSRYHVFPDTTSTVLGEHDLCLPDGLEF